jgi:thiamine biosynthesis lipoprotein
MSAAPALLLLPVDLTPGRLVRPAASAVHRLGGATMGTHWSLAFAGSRDPAEMRALVQAELDAVVAEMSSWEPESELSRFNRAPGGSWHDLSPGLFHVMRAALAMARRTGGAFDPTLGAVTNLWGFGPAAPAQLPPSVAALAAARARSGWRRIGFDLEARRLLQPGGLALDLCGIAKGHGADRAARALEQAGIASFLLEVGGELVARGLKSDGEPWWVDCETPPGADLPPTRIALVDMAVATSGDYRRYLTLEGRHLPHSFDAATGAPLGRAPASVTVLHPECMIADALATAITVLGVARGLALADAAQAAAIILHKEGDGEGRDVWRRSLSARALAMAES